MCVILVLICLVIGLDAGAHLQQLTTRGNPPRYEGNIKKSTYKGHQAGFKPETFVRQGDNANCYTTVLMIFLFNVIS